MNGNDSRTFVTRGCALRLALAFVPAMHASAQEAPEIDTSKWTCKFCEFEAGSSIRPTLGVGYVSDSSAKFGEYNGLNEQGTYVVADADGRYRSEQGLWIDLSAVDLGLDSRYVGVEGGRQGRYALHLSYRQLTHDLGDTARTPFLGTGSASLTLPSGWVSGATTGDMSALDSSLRLMDLETRRRQFELGGSFTPVTHWAFAVNLRHEEKSGTRGSGGSFLFNDSQLPMPVDFETDQFDVSAAYGVERFQARAAYYGSIFRNGDDALAWENPYLPLAAGGGVGQHALAPANQFHQITLNAGYKLAPRTQVMADVAYGRMTQDEAFLPYTVNASLPTQPLPRSSLDGRVETLSGDLKVSTVLSDELRVNASLAYDDRDNRTPQAVYAWITTDSAIGTPRTNLPYSFTRSVASIDGALALNPGLRIYAGCTYDEYRRDLQEVARTNEGGCWGKADLGATDVANLSLKWTHLQRTGSNYQPNPDDTPTQNPLMRLFNMADRDRDEVRLRVDLTPAEHFSIGFDTKATWDSYFNSEVGLFEGSSWSVAADCGWTIAEKVSANCYLGHEQVKSQQANAELLGSSPLWRGANRDAIDSIGAGVTYGAGEKFDFGVDYSYTRSTGEVEIAGATQGFPDLTTQRNSARLYVNFSPKKKLSLRFSYWYESYRSEDWALDGVLPATISNVLAFGQQSPDYDVDVLALSGSYEF